MAGNTFYNIPQEENSLHIKDKLDHLLGAGNPPRIPRSHPQYHQVAPQWHQNMEMPTFDDPMINQALEFHPWKGYGGYKDRMKLYNAIQWRRTPSEDLENMQSPEWRDALYRHIDNNNRLWGGY